MNVHDSDRLAAPLKIELLTGDWILLVAILGAISLTLRRRPETRYQAPEKQVRVRKEDRIRIIKMPRRPEEKS